LDLRGSGVNRTSKTLPANLALTLYIRKSAAIAMGKMGKGEDLPFFIFLILLPLFAFTSTRSSNELFIRPRFPLPPSLPHGLPCYREPLLTPSSFVEFETAADLRTAVEKLDHLEFKGSRVSCVADVRIPRSALLSRHSH
jgi:hypothetical protein